MKRFLVNMVAQQEDLRDFDLIYYGEGSCTVAYLESLDKRFPAYRAVEAHTLPPHYNFRLPPPPPPPHWADIMREERALAKAAFQKRSNPNHYRA